MKLGRTLATTAIVVLGAAGSASAHSQNTWARVGQKPLSDKAAAAQVRHVPEVRPMNVQANNYYVTNADLRYFHMVRNTSGQTANQFNHWNAYVDGRDRLKNPSTDDLIQWAAHKWGIPENWLRAQLAIESNWQMNLGGDLNQLPASWVSQYPASSRSVRGPNEVYESSGIAQIKWTPDNVVNPGTRYLRYRSTAFSLDYMGAEIRYYYDGDAIWLGHGYSAGNQWLSVGAWNSPAPWGNAQQQWYIGVVQQALHTHPWTSPNFPNSVYQRP